MALAQKVLIIFVIGVILFSLWCWTNWPKKPNLNVKVFRNQDDSIQFLMNNPGPYEIHDVKIKWSLNNSQGEVINNTLKKEEHITGRIPKAPGILKMSVSYNNISFSKNMDTREICSWSKAPAYSFKQFHPVYDLLFTITGLPGDLMFGPRKCD